MNFLADEGEAGVRSAYDAQTFTRLANLKARYDPTNLFHLNQNIKPASRPRKRRRTDNRRIEMAQLADKAI